MSKVKSLGVGVLALGSLAVLSLPANAATCTTGTVGQYTTPGFSCTLGSLTFSGFVVTPTVAGGGVVALTGFTPFSQVVNGVLETGLSLLYSATAFPGQIADVSWIYGVTSTVGIIDAYAALVTTVTGTGVSTVSELLSNGAVLNLSGTSQTVVTFAPTFDLGVLKDQINAVPSGPPGSGFSSASVLTNAFSVVPIPGALSLFGSGLLGLLILGRKRKAKKAPAISAA